MRQKRIETIVAWIGYSIVFIGLIALLLSLLRRVRDLQVEVKPPCVRPNSPQSDR